MELTHYGHSCVLVEAGAARLLFDPGTLSGGFEELTGLDAVLITHQHPDHLDVRKLPELLAANPSAELYTDPGTARELAEAHQSARVVGAGDSFKVRGVAVDVLGGQHAVIHPDIPIVPNTGYLIDHGAFYHPGDSFHVPDQRVDVLGLPTAAPWLKISEAIEFFRAVSPRVAVPIHQGLLALPEAFYSHFENLGPPASALTVLEHRSATEV
jgi:L-ascorbate metabolism protein UlaG (beta-lactamase superfamily)